MKNKRLIGIVVTAAFLLLIPLIVMQFTNEVNWTLSDFIVAGALLLGTGLMCELAIRKTNNVKYRIVICVALLVLLLLIFHPSIVTIEHYQSSRVPIDSIHLNSRLKIVK